MAFKSMNAVYLTALVIIGLTACVPATAPNDAPEADTCNASSYNSMLWKPKNGLDVMKLPKGTRVIGPETMVTMDYRRNRLNITYGKLGRIERIYCG